MSEKKKSSIGLALGAMIVGVASIPVTAFVSTLLGLVMMAAPIFMIYRAS
ncbi:MAG: hypothetical protein GXP19_06515 [Gammaproteobacteria bacterium]|nr:hypothetical protein [Gammaproteobacteria bacterium]